MRSSRRAPSPFQRGEAGRDWTADIAGVISPILVARYTVQALNYAAKLYLRQAGRIGEAALADIAGLPRWFEAGKVTGGLAAAVAVEAIVDAATGAVQRDKPAERHSRTACAAHQPQRTRWSMMRSTTTALAATEAYEVIQDLDPPPDKTQLDRIAEGIVRRHQFKVDVITDAAVRAALAALDGARGSWTNEDT